LRQGDDFGGRTLRMGICYPRQSRYSQAPFSLPAAGDLFAWSKDAGGPRGADGPQNPWPGAPRRRGNDRFSHPKSWIMPPRNQWDLELRGIEMGYPATCAAETSHRIKKAPPIRWG
jgi:hypothetical protein